MPQTPGRQSLSRFGAPLAYTLIAAGLLAVLLGYNGASSDPRVGAQLPYLISGLGVGLGLIVTGAALLVVRAARDDNAALMASLEDMVLALQVAGAPVTRSAAPPVPSNVAGLVAAGSASYHAPGCRLVDGREEVEYLTRAEARERDLKACRVCQPDKEPANVTVR